MSGPAAPVALGVAGLVVGAVLHRWLATRGYRYEDELDLPERGHRWVVPVLALAAAALGARFDDVPVLVTYGLALVWMAGLAVIDVDVRRLPDRWTLPAVPVAAALLGWCSWATDGRSGWQDWWPAVVAGLLNGAVYLVLALVNPAGLGLGDVKLAVPLGMLTGWFGATATVLAFLLAFVIGLVVGVVAAVRTREGRKATFPFGPSMLAGALVVILLVGPASPVSPG